MPTPYRIDPQRFQNAQTLEAYIDSAQKNQEFWRGVYRTARIPDELAERARRVRGTWNLLVLSEDWCGDAVNSVPIIARLSDELPRCRLRVLARDANPDVMDAHRTSGTRSIPVVMVLDDSFSERGWWGPRPRQLQEWFLGEGATLEKSERSRRIREWYARDRGRSAQEEVLALVEAAVATA